MLRKIITNTSFLILLLFVKTVGQNPLSKNHNYYKIGFIKTGVYKINLDFLKNIPNLPKNIDPNKIHIYAFPEKLLAQKNSISLNDNWQETPIYTDDKNGILEKQEAVYFYAESPNPIDYNENLGLFQQIDHPYTDSSYVLFSYNDTAPNLLGKSSPTAESSNTIDEFTHFEHVDFKKRNMLNSGRLWVSDYFNSKFQYKYTIDGILNKSATISSKVLGTMYSEQTMKVLANTTQIGTHNFEITRYNPRDLDANLRYSKIGDLDVKLFSFSPSNSELNIEYQLENLSNSPSGAYVDEISINCKRKLKFYDTQTLAYFEPSQLDKNLVIDKNSQNQFIWDVSKPITPLEIIGKENLNTISIKLKSNSEYSKLLFWKPEQALNPKFIEKIDFLNLENLDIPDLLIISPKAFISEANRLSQYRNTKNNISSLVLSTDEVYNRFSGGKIDISAIRNLCKYFWNKDSSKFKYLLLFADATYDPKNNANYIYVNPKNNIPTYESFESLEPIYSYSSDDYFGFLEPHEGNWPEGSRINGFWQSNTENDHTMEIAVGRLPINTLEEAKNLVNKLINYDKPSNSAENWKLNLNYVADDGDYNLHQRDAERLSEMSPEIFNKEKIYLDAFNQVSTPNGTRAPMATKQLNKAIEDGSFLINYNGHGSENGWTDEKLLTIEEINEWRNFNKLSIFFTATCQFGKFDNPSISSGAELALNNPRGGAIALLTTTRPVYSSSNYVINTSFLANLANENNSRLGDLFRLTKNESISGEINRNFSLLGDPSMPLNLPKQKININNISGKAIEDIQLKALNSYEINGTVKGKEFNGKVLIKIYDKPQTAFTLGSDKENPIMSYINDNSLIYSGIVNVKNGLFTSKFKIPKDINYSLGYGSIQMFAVSDDSTETYSGIFKKLLIGGSPEVIEVSDTKGPEVSFQQSQNEIRLNIIDESGINISTNSVGRGLFLIFNDTLRINVAEYLINIDNQGIITYDITKFPPGTYILEVNVWDSYNNKSIKTFNFNIEKIKMEILELSNFPNPFSNQTNFKLKHNRSGDDLVIRLRILDEIGRVYFENSENCFSCDQNIEFGLDFDSIKIKEGNYLYQFFLKSLTQKTETKGSSRLIFWK